MPGNPADPKSWYDKADADLTLRGERWTRPIRWPNLPLTTAQQCAEKYLKGFLVSASVPFRFVHDLGYLVHLCRCVAPEFAQLEDRVLRLTRYATESRYPREDAVPCTEQEARDAIDLAVQIRDFVLAK